MGVKPIVLGRSRIWEIVLTFCFCLASWACGTDQFRIADDGSGSSGSDGSMMGGANACCAGDGGRGGGDELPAGTGGGFVGACELSTSYCAVDWVGSWDKPGFQEGIGEGARFSQLAGTAVSGGTLYVTHGHAVSAVDLESRRVTLVAGGSDSGDIDAAGEAARFSSPTGILAHEGFLYVSDTGNRKIKRINLSSGLVNTYSKTLTSGPAGLELLPAEGTSPPYLLIADEALHIIVRLAIAEVAPTPGIIAGSHGVAGNNSVLLNRPHGIVRVGKRLYITERGNHWIRSIDLAKVPPISLEAEWGSGSAGFSEGVGSQARLDSPTGIAASGEVLFVVDSQNSVIRRGLRGESLKVVAGVPSDPAHIQGRGDEARFLDPALIQIAAGGDAFIGEGTVLRRLVLD